MYPTGGPSGKGEKMPCSVSDQFLRVDETGLCKAEAPVGYDLGGIVVGQLPGAG